MKIKTIFAAIMAKGNTDIIALSKKITEDVQKGIFSSVYLLMGEEQYYVNLLCDRIIEHALEEEERDFNQTIIYGPESDAETVITAARRYPMFAERNLVVVKQAQSLKNFDDLSYYCANPLDSTVLVVCVNGLADKRKSFYKSASKIGVVVESNPVRDYEISRWIDSFYADKGLRIEPRAAQLLGEHAGTDLSKIAVETDKLLKNLPEGTRTITVEDIEKNVGISRQFSIFELTKELSYRNGVNALRIAAYLGASPKFAMPMAVSALYTHFYRILKYGALLSANRNAPQDARARVLGVSPYFFKEYDAAVSAYPMVKAMGAVALLRDYDFIGKGGGSQETSPSEMLQELVAKLLNLE